MIPFRERGNGRQISSSDRAGFGCGSSWRAAPLPGCRDAPGGTMLKRSWRGTLAATIMVVLGLACFSAPAGAAPASAPPDAPSPSGETATISTPGSAGSVQWARIRWPLVGVLASAVILVVVRQTSLFVAWRTGSLVRPQRTTTPHRPPLADPTSARTTALEERTPAHGWESGWSTAGSGD